MRGYIIDPKSNQAGSVEVEPSLAEYYRLIGCECIDIILRRINGVNVNIILDDKGLLKPNVTSGFAKNRNERLAGTLLLFGADRFGFEMTSLTDGEIDAIDKSVIYAIAQTEEKFEIYPVLRYEV